MELMPALRRLGRIFWPPPILDAHVAEPFPSVERDRIERIEAFARYLVQKIAREEAARHAHAVLLHSPVPLEWQGNVATCDTRAIMHAVGASQRRADQATRLRVKALTDLRLALGLPEDPTQAECGIWGEAP